MGVKVDISVIIPLYKGRKFCENLLSMLEKNCLYQDMFKKCKIELILVNDYPDEKILVEKKNWHFNILLIEQEKNFGIHHSRVNGINHARGEYIIMLDQDDLVRENWLYSQWHKMVTDNSDYCICNGWLGRFRVLWEEKTFAGRVNDLDYYLSVRNNICSPGQVMIRKRSIPQEWLEHIQKCNGADDYLLWIMALKKNNQFSLNKDYLYYHTPQRNPDSIGETEMLESIKEMSELLDFIGLLEKEELSLLNRQIARREYANCGIQMKTTDGINSEDWNWFSRYIKFQKMFYLMLDWVKIKNRGIKISEFFKKNNYLNIAIYGMGYIGECLYDELKGSGIQVKYGIDRTARDFKGELPIYRIEDELERVDMIVVTVMENTKNIIDKLKRDGEYPVMAISELLIALGDNYTNGEYYDS